MFEPVTTIIGVFSLINSLFHIFKRISSWLKRRANTTWKEDKRILKILRDYAKRNSDEHSKLQNV